MHPLALSLLRWYDSCARTLPWRVTGDQCHDPYTVWVSEIMLQQTTVPTVLNYFPPFIETFPTVHHLASASLDEVLTHWQGLGYYRRARMMHRCAQVIVENYGGVFPHDLKELLDLPGIGAYTAGAIRAIAFQKRAIAIDGNVKRVIRRLLGIQTPPQPSDDPTYHQFLDTITPQEKRCGDFVQALMELGATVCTPRRPSCTACPWQISCQTLQQGLSMNIPKSTKSKPHRYGIAYVLRNGDGALLLERRPTEGLLGGLFGFPTSVWQTEPLGHTAPPYPCTNPVWFEDAVEHVFTHFKLTLTLYMGEVISSSIEHPEGYWVKPYELEGYALPTLFKKVLRCIYTPSNTPLPFKERV